MQRWLPAFFIAILMLSGHVSANDTVDNPTIKSDSNGFAGLASWATKSPTSIPAKNDLNLPAQGNIWDDPKVMTTLEKTMGKDRVQDIITGWGAGYAFANEVNRITDPKIGDFIGFFACKPRDCASHEAFVFINLENGIVQACWVEEAPDLAHPGKVISVETWLSPAGVRKLAEGDCSSEHSLARLLQGHGDQTVKKDTKVN